LGNFKKFTKLSKRELDNKLIIQHFHHIHIHTMTYTMYFLNFSTLKKYIIVVFSNYTRIWNINARVHKKITNIYKCKFFLCRLVDRILMQTGLLRTYKFTIFTNSLSWPIFFSWNYGPTWLTMPILWFLTRPLPNQRDHTNSRSNHFDYETYLTVLRLYT